MSSSNDTAYQPSSRTTSLPHHVNPTRWQLVWSEPPPCTAKGRKNSRHVADQNRCVQYNAEDVRLDRFHFYCTTEGCPTWVATCLWRPPWSSGCVKDLPGDMTGWEESHMTAQRCPKSEMGDGLHSAITRPATDRVGRIVDCLACNKSSVAMYWPAGTGSTSAS